MTNSGRFIRDFSSLKSESPTSWIAPPHPKSWENWDNLHRWGLVEQAFGLNSQTQRSDTLGLGFLHVAAFQVDTNVKYT